MFFKGYVPTKKKKCLMSYKDKRPDQLLTIEEAGKLDEYAGILDTNTILIDVDEMEQAKKLFNLIESKECRCRVYQSTRGLHFLFLNTKGVVDKCYTHTNLACGINADIKVGLKNSYEVLKIDGKERVILYDKLDDEEYQEVPFYLLPVKDKTDFPNMGDGDGRNKSLFSYILALNREGFTKEQTREILTLINKFVFKKPLAESELEVIMRDDAFPEEEDDGPKFFDKNKKFLFDNFSHYLMEKANIVNLYNELYIYQDGVYVNGNTFIEREMINHISRLTNSQRTEVLKYLKLIAPRIEASSEYYIAFNNGIYDLASDSMMQFSEEFVITNKIPWDYNPDAYSEIADRTLNKLACNDSSIRAVLEECIGYCFFRRNELRKSFMLLGEKKNGKSTFLEMLKNVIGKDNCSALDLKEIGDRFRTAQIFGRLVNIGDDIDSQYIENVGTFKKVVSGNGITIENKGQDPIEIEPYCKFIFSANDIPRMKDRSGAVLDRLIFIPFNAVFSKEDPDFDPYIIDKLRTREATEYLIRIGIAGLKRVLEKREFTVPEQSKTELQEFNERNNPILLFIKEINEEDVVGKIVNDVYLQYSEWCIDNGFQAVSNIEFGKTIRKTFDLETQPKKIDGKSYRIFVKKNIEF